MTIKSWTDYFLDMAKTCSSRSNCLRAQVGAVIVGEDKKIKARKHKEVKPMEKTMKIEGMMCPHCKAMVEKVCKAVPGTADAVVDLQAKNVTVTGDADVNALKMAIAEAGYEVVD